MTKARIRQLEDFVLRNKGDAGLVICECLDEIKRMQGFTRRGIGPDAEPIPPAEKTKAKADPRVKEFIDGWFDAYKEFHKRSHLIYKVQGVKDAMAVKRLLSLKIWDSTLKSERPIQVDDLLDQAWEAWHHRDKFWCKMSTTILGFEQRYNDIRVEVVAGQNGNRPVRTQPAGCTL